MMRTTMTMAVLAAALCAQPKTAGPEALLGEALHHERVTGNLQSAIDGYKKVLAGKGVSRKVAAEAEYHIGLCYEKLGNQEARRAFERVVKNYGDQAQFAAQARARLAAMGAGPASDGSVRTRLLWDNAEDITGSISADGRYVTYTDWKTGGQLGLRDLVTGQNRLLGGPGEDVQATGWTAKSVISPDGRRIAYSYEPYRKPGMPQEPVRLQVIGADGSGHKVFLAGESFDYVEPHSWSPDGKWLVAGLRSQAGGGAAALISAEDGKRRILSTQDKVWRGNITFSPDGRWLAYSRNVVTIGMTRDLYVMPADGNTEMEKKLEENASMMGWTPDGKGILFQRERAGIPTLYLLPVSGGERAGEPQLVNGAADLGTTSLGVTARGMLVTGTYNRKRDGLVFAWDGDPAHLQKPLYSFPVRHEVGLALGGGLLRFTADGKKLLAVVPNGGILVRELSTGVERVVTPQMKEMQRVEWAHDGGSILVGGVGADRTLGLFRVNEATGQAEKIAGERMARFFEPGRDGKTIYFWLPRERKVYAHDLPSGQDRLLLENAPQGNWHMEESHDGTRLAVKGASGIVVVDLKSGQAQTIYRSPEGSHEAIWALQWSPDDSQLLTIFRVAGGMERMDLVTFPSAGGPPLRRPIDKSFAGLALSPDGKLLATSRESQRTQIWGLENFLPEVK